RFQRQRKPRTGRPASDDGDDLIAMLPSIAVRAVMHRDAIALLETRNVGHMIANAAGDERHACVDGLMVVECRFKEVAGMRQMRDRCAAWFDAIRAQLLASKSKQLQRWDTVAAEEGVQGRRAGVSRLSRLAQ